MCVNPKVKTKTSTGADINHACSSLGKERKCRFRNNLDGFTPPSDGTGCGNEEVQQPVLDMEDLVSMGHTSKVCPFYFTRSHVADADIIFVPYNYLFEKTSREGTLKDVKFEDSIIIFDEAHNLESFASDSASFDLTAVDIAGCIGEVARAIGYMQAHSEAGGTKSMLDNLIKLKSIFLRLEDHLDNGAIPTGGRTTNPSEGRSFPGDYIFEIFKTAALLTYDNHGVMVEFIKKVSDTIMEIRGTASSGTPKLDHYVSCIKRVFGGSSEAHCIAKSSSYRVHVTTRKAMGNSGQTGRTLSYWCFAPSMSMHELQSLKVRSIIVTSGTLSPLPSYSLELGLNFPHTLENPHIIQSDQVHVRVVGKGVSGKLLKSTYDRRNDVEYLTELGNTIISLARVTPGGMLIFFPSYGVMDTYVERWGGPASSRRPYGNSGGNGQNNFFAARQKKNSSTPAGGRTRYSFPHAPVYYATDAATSPSTPWKRLLSTKAVVLEPKTTSELKDAIAEFDKFIEMPKSTGCVLMGVCRGKISEGIDFANDKCRAVVITGLPFSPMTDPKVKLKKEYLDSARASQSAKPSGEGGFGSSSKTTGSSAAAKPSVLSPTTTLSGQEWYIQQAHRAVNQAVGRVIRHKSDYGAVLLLDSRYGDPRNQSGMSKWLRPHIMNDEGIGRAIGGLAKFFKAAKAKSDEISRMANDPETHNTGIQLAYEDDETRESIRKEAAMASVEDEDESMTRIAFIQTTRLPQNTTSTFPEAGKRTDQSASNSSDKGSKSEGNENTSYDNDDEALLRGFVRPERVIQRLDLQSSSNGGRDRDKYGETDNLSSKMIVDKKNESSSTRPSQLGLSAIYEKGQNRSSAPGGASIRNSYQRRDYKSLSATIESAWSRLDSGKLKSVDSSIVVNRNLKRKHPESSRLISSTSTNVAIDAGLGNPSARTSSKPLDKSTKSPAAKFLELSKRTMAPDDLRKVQTMLIAMRAHKEKKDTKPYLSSAKELVMLLAQYDIKSDEDKNHIGIETSKLLDLLYPLLPDRFCNQIKKMAVSEKFKMSRFSSECKAKMSPDDYAMICESVPSLLVEKSLLRSNSQMDGRMDPSLRQYLNDTKPVIELVINYDDNQELIDLFTCIVPFSCRAPLKAMVERLKVSNRIKRVKDAENRKRGENSLNPVLFRRTDPGSQMKTEQTDKNDGDANPQAYEDRKNMEGALMHVQEMKIKREQKVRQMEALSKAKVMEHKTCTASKSAMSNNTSVSNHMVKNDRKFLDQPKKQSKHVVHGVSIPSFALESSSLLTQDIADHVDRCLRQAKKDVFVPPRARNINANINSNVPLGFVCTVCEAPPEKPYMADCGHSACLQCWLKWLGKAGTCPVCRASTSKGKLSRMVFEKKPGAGVPTMSQICASSDEDQGDGESSDEELELVSR
eukprot:scaffold37345_cov53-Attheya_sp.AAC.1